MVKKDTRFVALGCLHLPYHDSQYLDVFYQFIEWYKPDKIVLNGDILDCAPVSHWLQDKRKQKEGLRLADDFGVGNAFLNRITKTCRNIVYNEGNHEDWIDQAIDKAPELDGLINLEVGLRFSERRKKGTRIEHNKYGEMSNIGKVYFTHGVYCGLNHARKHVEKFQRNLLYAHTHTVQSYSNFRPVDAEQHVAKSIGCGLKLNPSYMRNKPHDWVHAFEAGVVRRDGGWNSDTIIVRDGIATYAGKTFKTKYQD